MRGWVSLMRGVIEAVEIGKRSVGVAERFRIAPDEFDVVPFRSAFGSPFDDEPIGAVGERVADADRIGVKNPHDRRVRRVEFTTLAGIERIQICDEFCASLGSADRYGEFAPGVVNRGRRRHLLNSSGRRSPEVRAPPGPDACEPGMRQGFLVAGGQPHGVVGLDARLGQFPTRTALSTARRASVEWTPFVSGAGSSSSPTRKAALVVKGVNPGSDAAAYVFAPPFVNSPRRNRTACSRVQNAYAISGQAQLQGVKSRALALSAAIRFEPSAVIKYGNLRSRRDNWRIADDDQAPGLPGRGQSPPHFARKTKQGRLAR